jgi:ribosomal protein S18 acetylase RimI-like enzyme
VSVFGLILQRYRPAAMPDIVPFADEHLDAAAELLAARHARHREHEPLLPAVDDFRAAIEKEWQVDGASGAFATRDGAPAAYLVARPQPAGGQQTWMIAGIAGHAVEGDPELVRDLYAAAAQRWFDAGHTRHAVFLPAYDAAVVDRWFRLSFGASAVLAMRETAPEPAVDGDVTIRPGTLDDLEDAARLDLAMSDSMRPAPSFSGLSAETLDELVDDWRDTWADEHFEHFVAERDGRIVGHSLLYRRPADLRVPVDSIDLAGASTLPELRGSGVGRALTAHVISWSHEQGIPTMVTDWRMTNLLASRFWPRRGFRETFLRLYRAIP